MKALREGFTTGSCAAAAALASCLWQRDGACPERVGIVVPAGKTFAPEIIAHGGYVCGVIKDGGDDPELEAAAALVDSRYRKKLAIGRRDLVVAALQRRGFAYPVIKEAIRRVEEGE